MSVDVSDTVDASIHTKELARQFKNMELSDLAEIKDALNDALHERKLAKIHESDRGTLYDQVLIDRLHALASRLTLDDLEQIEKQFLK